MKNFALLLLLLITPFPITAEVKDQWKKHLVWEGLRCNVAVAADFTGDGKIDIISSAGGKTRLHVAPSWKEIIIGDDKDHTFIHGETFDVDEDGDADFIGARYKPGLIVWFEQPNKNPTTNPNNLAQVAFKI